MHPAFLLTAAHIMTWLDDCLYECESMHGKDRAHLVAQSLYAVVDWIERVVQEASVRRGVLFHASPRCAGGQRKNYNTGLCGLESKLPHVCVGGRGKARARVQVQAVPCPGPRPHLLLASQCWQCAWNHGSTPISRQLHT